MATAAYGDDEGLQMYTFQFPLLEDARQRKNKIQRNHIDLSQNYSEREQTSLFSFKRGPVLPVHNVHHCAVSCSISLYATLTSLAFFMHQERTAALYVVCDSLI